MHEYSIVQALLDRVDAEARAHAASAVRRIQVRLGELSGVERDLLESAYLLCRERTLCADAALDILPVAARWSCPRCDRVFFRGEVLRCTACGLSARLICGDEILLERIEMEVP